MACADLFHLLGRVYTELLVYLYHSCHKINVNKKRRKLKKKRVPLSEFEFPAQSFEMNDNNKDFT